MQVEFLRTLFKARWELLLSLQGTHFEFVMSLLGAHWEIILRKYVIFHLFNMINFTLCKTGLLDKAFFTI